MLVRAEEDLFLFYNQKTAYEMRISDWSSDVCSSDLFDAFDVEERKRQKEVGRLVNIVEVQRGRRTAVRAIIVATAETAHRDDLGRAAAEIGRDADAGRLFDDPFEIADAALLDISAAEGRDRRRNVRQARRALLRSEEHTSELQSLMRISY